MTSSKVNKYISLKGIMLIKQLNMYSNHLEFISTHEHLNLLTLMMVNAFG